MRLIVPTAFVLLSIASASNAQIPAAPADWQRAYQPGSGISNPVALVQPEPRYTADALRQKISGEVWVEVIVEADGSVKDVRVIRSLDKQFGLDEQAIAAAKQWMFQPGRTREGQAVPVRVTLILNFIAGDQQT